MKIHKIKEKAQAAMEFLMSYGWAIFTVLIVIGALAYFGVLSPDKFLPERCSLPSGITCLDFNVETARIVLVLQNNFGSTITIERVEVTKKNNGLCFSAEAVVLKNDEKAIIAILDCNNGDIGEKFIGYINITYTKEGTLPHLMKGGIIARIMGESFISSSGICQNAQNASLCEGLDIVYGEGYQEACCSEFSLCC